MDPVSRLFQAAKTRSRVSEERSGIDPPMSLSWSASSSSIVSAERSGSEPLRPFANRYNAWTRSATQATPFHSHSVPGGSRQPLSLIHSVPLVDSYSAIRVERSLGGTCAARVLHQVRPTTIANNTHTPEIAARSAALANIAPSGC